MFLYSGVLKGIEGPVESMGNRVCNGFLLDGSLASQWFFRGRKGP